jgi:hypothetical protein
MLTFKPFKRLKDNFKVREMVRRTERKVARQKKMEVEASHQERKEQLATA